MATVLTAKRNGFRLPSRSAPAVVRVGIYARVSAADKTNSSFTSIDAQVAACRSYVDSRASNGWLVAETFIDDGRSGKDTNRPGLSRLFEDVRAERINVVLVHRIDRLSRSLRDLLGLVAIMEEHGVAFGSICESFDSSTPIGRATLQLVGVFAELERSTIAERTRSKIRAARRLGRWTGGCPPWGYDVIDSKLVVNEIESHRVREAFRLYLECGSLLDAAAELNARGWTTKITATRNGGSRGGKPWNKGNLHGVLTSPLYVGRIIANGEAVAGEHEAIVPVEVWEAVQERLSGNAVAGSSGERHHSGSLLGGLLKCEICGASMVYSFCVKRRGDARVRYAQYRCSTKIKRGAAACSSRSINAAKAEAEVVAEIAKRATDPEIIDAVVEATRQGLAERKKTVSDETRALSRAIRDAEKERERMTGDAAAVARIDARLAEHRGRLDALQAERVALEATNVDPNQIAALLTTDFQSVWTAMTSRERRKVVELLSGSISAAPAHD
jgi:site-specific DNA recombinase